MCGVAESEGEHSWCDAMGEMQKGAFFHLDQLYRVSESTGFTIIIFTLPL